MPRSHKEVEILIVKLEQSLRGAMLWSSCAPPVDAFKSQLPFSLDTMAFEQWLQFVFIPKMTEVINDQSTLPSNLHLLPIAEQSPNLGGDQSEVMAVIKEIDSMFSCV